MSELEALGEALKRTRECKRMNNLMMELKFQDSVDCSIFEVAIYNLYERFKIEEDARKKAETRLDRL